MATVLVVDDEEPILGILTEVIEEMGHEVLRAMNGREALAVVQNTPPDLVLTDVMMPYLNGVELCRAIKGNGTTAHIVVLLMSAVPVERRREAGADGFIHKPFSLEDVESAIAAGLTAPSANSRHAP
jgi:two-component system, sensor histidine kinase and response regulator